jgi:hypothetical protein
MIQLSCALLFSAPLMFAPDFETPGEDGAEDYLRVYDVSSLSLSWFNEDEAGTVMMPGFEREDDGGGDSAQPELGSIDTFIDIILDLYEAEFEYEGRRVALGSDGRFVVRGPESLHQSVAGTLTFLESVVNAECVLAIDTVVLTGPGPDGVLIDQAEVEAWLTGLDASVEHQHQLLRVRTDRKSRLDLGRYEPTVLEFDVQIAQGSAIHDPVLSVVHSGTQLEVIGAPTTGGTSLAFVLSRNDRLPTEPTEVDSSFLVGMEKQGVERVHELTRRSNLHVMSRVHAMSTFLPRGKALVLSHGVDVTGGKLREVVVIRQVGGGLPTRHEMELSDGGARLVFADLGAVAPPHASFIGRLFADDSTPGGPLSHTTYEGEPLLSSSLGLEDLDLAMELLDMNISYSSLDYVGRYLVSRPLARSSEGDEEQAKLEQARLMSAFESLLPSEVVYDLELVVRNGGDEPVRARMPIRAGTEAATVLGVQFNEVHDIDVEVAQSVAVGQTLERTVLDGLCLWIRLAPAQGGELVLDLVGGAQLAGAQTKFDLGSSVLDFVHQTGLDCLVLKERTLLQDVDGVWSATFGDTSGGGLSLAVRVTRAN